MVNPLGLIFKNYLNIYNLNFESHWWILLLNFSVLTCESDSCIFQVLEWTEFDLSKINWLRDVLLFHSNNVGALGQVFIVSHSYQIYFDFRESNLNLDFGLRDHEVRIGFFLVFL